MIETPSAAKFALSCIERVCQWVIDSGHREMANPASGPRAQERGENWEAAEISLSHRVGGSVVASYARSDMLTLRAI